MLLPSSLDSFWFFSNLFTTFAPDQAQEPPTFFPSVMQINFFSLQLHPQTFISKSVKVFRWTQGSTPYEMTSLPSSNSDILSRSLVSGNAFKCSFYSHIKQRESPIESTSYVLFKASHELLNIWNIFISYIYI